MGKTYIGDNQIKKVYIGEDQIKKIYIGDDLVYSAEFYVYNAGKVGEGEGKVTLEIGHQGWNSNSVKNSSDSSINENDIHLIGAGSGSGTSGKDNVDSAAWAVFDNVDFTDYDTLSMTFDFSAVSGGAPSILGVIDSLPSMGAGVPQTQIDYEAQNTYKTGVTGGSASNITISCDVSSIIGIKKVLVMTYAASYNEYYYSDLYVYSIKLE